MCIGSCWTFNLEIWDKYNEFEYEFYIVWCMVHNAAAFCLLDKEFASVITTVMADPMYVHCVHHHKIHTHMTDAIHAFVSCELPCTNGFWQQRVVAQYV